MFLLSKKRFTEKGFSEPFWRSSFSSSIHWSKSDERWCASNKFNSSIIILTVKRLSERKISWSLTTFSAVFETEGLPLRGSSSIYSLPSENALNHRNTWALDKTLGYIRRFSEVLQMFSIALCSSLK
ncbi:uncharacterized protein TNCV_4058711 [Trichonephila clavipes]|nr:uncharacterized protein TNCV_4058711 [Trichonephila clavipes]